MTDKLSLTFLPEKPTIDGHLKPFLQNLQKYTFPTIQRSSPDNHTVSPSFHIAYGTEFLYLVLRLDKDFIHCRDRAYQFGDGLHLAVTGPKSNSETTDAFYVLGFSPQNDPTRGWQKKFTWYKNTKLGFTMLDHTEFAFSSDQTTSIFEICIPWKDIYPFHPWLSSEIGINLCYVESIGEGSALNQYFLHQDPLFMAEGMERPHFPVQFETPVLESGAQVYTILEKNHISGYEKPTLIFTGISSGEITSVEQRAYLHAGEGDRVGFQKFDVPTATTPQIGSHKLDFGSLSPGGYQLCIKKNITVEKQKMGLSILPEANIPSLIKEFKPLTKNLSENTINTMQFQLDSCAQIYEQLKPSDTAYLYRNQLGNCISAIRHLQAGRDPIQTQTGISRRAYRSSFDGELVPYSLRIPNLYSSEKSYPLIVYLHGSGEDDQGQLTKFSFPDDYFVLAVNGRGVSNAYGTKAAQEDIKDAVADVSKIYPINTKKIILTGFSMGGYGVYRTYYETPETYAGLAAFSGAADLINLYIGYAAAAGFKDEAEREFQGCIRPNFLQDEYLPPFKNAQIFIFHGVEDNSTSFADAKLLAEKFQTIGAEVTTCFEEGLGHEYPSPKTIQTYFDWVTKL